LTPEQFAEAFTESSRTLWCIAAGVLGNRDAADDVLQDAAMIALNKLEQFDPDTSFTAWTGRIVRYVALNHARRRQRTRATAMDPVTLDAVTPNRDGAVTSAADGRGQLLPDQECFDDDVLNALGGLEEIARACLLLRTVLELPYREIALALDIPEGTAMSHVHRSRRVMRERLRDRATGAVGCKDVSP
jgi:RNA polymerase sigma-70 factor (ECF subfamily)